MKISRLFGGLFGIIGIALGVFSVFLGVVCVDASPVLLAQPQAARERAEAVLSAVCEADHKRASAMILGAPDFAMEAHGEDPVEQMVWDRFIHSFSYRLVGECFATESGVAQKALVSFLDLDSVTNPLRQRIQALLEQRIQGTEDMSAIYDENHEFLEEFVLEALADATREALAQDARTVTREVTLRLIYREGQWWVLPDPELLRVLTGTVLR